MYVTWFALLALFLVRVSAQGLTSNQVDTVKQLLAKGATHRSAVPPPLCLVHIYSFHFTSVGSSAPAPKLSSSSTLPPFLCSPHRSPSPLLPPWTIPRTILSPMSSQSHEMPSRHCPLHRVMAPASPSYWGTAAQATPPALEQPS